MRRRGWSALLVTAALVVAVHAAPAEATPSATARVIVTIDRSGGVARSAVTSGTGAHLDHEIAPGVVAVDVPAKDVADAEAKMRGRPGVVAVQPNLPYHAALAPNDHCFVTTCAGVQQWNAQRVGLPIAWDLGTGSPSLKLGVLDSGVDTGNPDLVGHVTRGPNYSDDADPRDLNGHGTHVTGILAASLNNGIGVAGTAPRSPVVVVKVLDHNGDGTTESVVEGLHWVADNGVRIVNLSLGGATHDPALDDAVAYAQSRGVLVVAAADNAGTNTPYYPGATAGVLSVASTDAGDHISAFSNYGSWVDIAAPGEDIISTWSQDASTPAQYAVESGTSMSTPLVAGTAALVWAQRPYLSWSGVVDRLMATAVHIAGSGTDVRSGRLDAAAAVTLQPDGYRLVASDGGVFAYGASFSGSGAGSPVSHGFVAGASSGDPNGYWLATSAGEVATFGDAPSFGPPHAMALSAPVVGMHATESGDGYWLVASDGGVFSFGDAQFHGSTGGMRLNAPIVDIVPTASGRGYWLVASDGGVFSFGDAQFHGSTGDMRLNAPIVGGERTAAGDGYWLVASDGGIFSFGDAQFYGSTGGMHLNAPVVDMVPAGDGNGYRLIASDGGVFCYGTAGFLGSTGGMRLNQPIVGVVSG